jgi:hypothetical protein
MVAWYQDRLTDRPSVVRYLCVVIARASDPGRGVGRWWAVTVPNDVPCKRVKLMMGGGGGSDRQPFQIVEMIRNTRMARPWCPLVWLCGTTPAAYGSYRSLWREERIDWLIDWRRKLNLERHVIQKLSNFSNMTRSFHNEHSQGYDNVLRDQISQRRATGVYEAMIELSLPWENLRETFC